MVSAASETDDAPRAAGGQGSGGGVSRKPAFTAPRKFTVTAAVKGPAAAAAAPLPQPVTAALPWPLDSSSSAPRAMSPPKQQQPYTVSAFGQDNLPPRERQQDNRRGSASSSAGLLSGSASGVVGLGDNRRKSSKSITAYCTLNGRFSPWVSSENAEGIVNCP